MHISIDRDSAVPFYHQVKEAVKAQIAHGELKPGDMLPSEFSLSEQLGISRLVVHRALRELVTEGLLIRKRAVGTFVSPPAKRGYSVVGPLLSMTENLARDGVRHQNQILKQEIIPADEAVKGELGLVGGAMVVHLYNLRLADGLPLAVEDMYFPAERFAALAELDLNNHSIYAALEKRYHAHPQEALDLVAAGAATRDEARLLGINKGAPVMRVQRTSTDRQGRCMEFSKVTFHAERYQFMARVQRTG
ncbi:MAG TPA: GntR family transcriptional regulator [Anaerolineales bacterium]